MASNKCIFVNCYFIEKKFNIAFLPGSSLKYKATKGTLFYFKISILSKLKIFANKKINRKRYKNV
jgi:hypothetical protein